MASICTKNFKSKFASLKIERLILRIPLNTIENRVSEKILTANVFNETFVKTCSFLQSGLFENTIASNCWVRNVCNKC